jgi:hypothetical protein
MMIRRLSMKYPHDACTLNSDGLTGSTPDALCRLWGDNTVSVIHTLTNTVGWHDLGYRLALSQPQGPSPGLHRL